MSLGLSRDAAYAWFPHWTLSNDLVAFLQLVTLLVGGLSSVWLTNAITHRSLKEMLPQLSTIFGLECMFAVAVLGPGPPWH
ncbi:hypothetical protein NGA_0076800 [Nannochloropsis gaditana CCMP526]|uniref:uncharacterized protein n=1 Tax=Nannochloropsis gaditana (strain CCMP526) TaxID=1093141 RepID=UPI00029F6B37|nr:hypothetical protein NGA_0076800 [Nannochloropsis gaditana CCMP526]EKU20978.1 hypothetical protein NGA_0076800 [Nannochloropsis gaditana CCMP526]|eukprot:XP_005855379.1 hypothetical protein NGA_0076800 [Nannochloropsis gaditana CCMP526]